MALNVARLTLYKHGLGFFERSGMAEHSFTITFPRRAMDDVLKSLTIRPDGATVESIAFETPPDRNPNAQRQQLYLDPNRPLSSVLDAFSGHRVKASVGDRVIEGELIGLERENEEHLERALLVLLTASGIRLIALRDVAQLEIIDDDASGDLAFALEAQRLDSERPKARITLSGAAFVRINYIAPAPAWRASYRVLIGPRAEGTSSDDETCRVFVQGWGLFDNTLEDDLDNVKMTLTAGMPISFRYGLHQPNTPERPVVHDDERTVSAPIEFDAMSSFRPASGIQESTLASPAMMAAPIGGRSQAFAKLTADDLITAAPVQASTDSRGALFAYEIGSPVSVRRGESGMVPILSIDTTGTRELLYNPAKNDLHPVSSVRFDNVSITLERGPSVVLVNGEYAGESVLPFTPVGAGLILAFAIELGIVVTQQTQLHEETRSVRVQDRSLFVGVVEYRVTTYSVRSDLDMSCVLTIEHPRHVGAELVTTAVESTAHQARFKLPVSARSTVEFAVTEKREITRYEDVHGLTGDRLRAFLDGRVLDRATFDGLSMVIDRLARLDEAQRTISETDDEREKVRRRLDDTRRNLESVDATRDSALRLRFVTQLESLEDRMLAYDVADSRSYDEIQALEEKIVEELQRLSDTSPTTSA